MEKICQYGDLETAKAIIDAFLHCNLEKNKWTHEAHIITGFYLYTICGDEAIEKIESHIRLFNDSVGTINSTTSGFHKTLTFFWMNAIAQFADNVERLELNQRNLESLLNSPLTNSMLPQQFYSKACLHTSKARMEVVEPDLQPLSSIITLK